MATIAASQALRFKGVQLGTRFVKNSGVRLYFWHLEEREDQGSTELAFRIGKAVFLFSVQLYVHSFEGEESIGMLLLFSEYGSESLSIATQVSTVVNKYADHDPYVNVGHITYSDADAYWLRCRLYLVRKDVGAAIKQMKWLTEKILQALSDMDAVYVPKQP